MCSTAPSASLDGSRPCRPPKDKQARVRPSGHRTPRRLVKRSPRKRSLMGRGIGLSNDPFLASPESRHKEARIGVSGTTSQAPFLASATPDNTTPGSVARNATWLPEGKLYTSECLTVRVTSVAV